MANTLRVSFACLLLLPVLAYGQEEPPLPFNAAVAEKPVEPPRAVANGKLRFAFDRTPWKEVIKWLAEESGLALHVRDLPTGSFTYSDPSEFTLDEAIDRVNLFLLADGYTIVRNGKLLSVINIADPRSLEQLDVLARLTTADQLSELNKHDVVKCIFTLGELNATDAVDELSALKLMTTPAVFAKTNRIMITDTVGKLLSVKAILDGFEPKSLNNGTVMKNFELQHVDAEDILMVARPHLGLATGEMIGIDVSMSADLKGENIFVTGVDDKVKVIEGLVEALDKPKAGIAGATSEAQLKNYVIKGGNAETIFNVLQTILAGTEMRLSLDEKAGAIVALATPSVQTEIEKTINQLQAAEAEFEVINLSYADPYYVISLLEEMLDLPDPYLTEPEDIDPDAPKIDADPDNMRIYVRGKQHQIEKIKQIITQLDKPAGMGEGSEKIRLFPLTKKNGEKTLALAAKLWKGDNSVVLFPTTTASEPAVEKTLVDEPSATEISNPIESPVEDDPQVLSVPRKPGAAMISCEFTARGLMLQSEDIEGLNLFSEHLRGVAGKTAPRTGKPVVYYLKFAKAENAVRTLAELLDGGEAAGEGSESGSLINSSLYSTTSSFYSFVTTRGGMTTLTADSLSVVVDTRLNRLIVQGTTSDIALVESYLKIIDKDSSITDIATGGESHFIELVHSDAEEVAETIRQAFATRIVRAVPGQNPQQQQPQAGGGRQQPPSNNQQENNEGDNKKGKEKKNQPAAPAGSKPLDLEPKMTVAVHAASNSLIITAPKPLFAQVERLVQKIEANNEEVIEVVTPIAPNNLDFLLQTLQQELPERSTESTAQPPRTSPPSPTSPPRPQRTPR